MKPDWKDAPSRAQWLAQDNNGRWYWYAIKPEIGPYGQWLAAGSDYSEEAEQHISNWCESLEERPQ